MALHNWFIPHKQTHQKAKLLSWQSLAIYVLLFIFLQVGFSIVSYTKPGILGVTANIDQKTVIDLTNQERVKMGLSPVEENIALDKAAQLKAQNMFTENYWAHFSPSGKSPWDFILGSGYKFTYAGENLAKNFYSANEVVVAWMNSPTHRENLLNNKYRDIGVAVAEGVLNGQKTVLVVQEFGTTVVPPALAQGSDQPTVTVSGEKLPVSRQEYNSQPMLVTPSVAGDSTIRTLFDPYVVYRVLGVSVISFLGVLLMLDLVILKRRGVLRIGSYHLAHFALLSVSLTTILHSGPGAIL